MSQSTASDLPAGQSLPSGSRLEEFIIERVLGSGGFGITYLAQDSSLGRRVVIKENLPVQFCWREPSSLTVQPRHSKGEDADNFQYSLESFKREASMLASLDHPGIVKVLRSFEAYGTAYFVMPFVEGTALDEVLRQRTEQKKAFTESELKDLLSKVLDALGYLHDRGIYHRDIKPGNILMTTTGEPVLIDFGAARQRLSERSLTVIESAGYTPFEQLQSRGKVGPWSDIYALGATLYKVISGETPAKAADRAFDDPQVSLAQRAELRRRYTPSLLESIDQAMAPKASERFQDTSQWRDRVESRNVIAPPALEAVVTPPRPVVRKPGANSLHEEHRRILAEATAAIARNDSVAAASLFKQLENKRFVDLDYSKVKAYVLQRKERRAYFVTGAIVVLLALGGWAGLSTRNERIAKAQADAVAERLVQENAEAGAQRIAQEKATAEATRRAQEKADAEAIRIAKQSADARMNKERQEAAVENIQKQMASRDQIAKTKTTSAINSTSAHISPNVRQPARSELPDQKAAEAGDIDAQFRMGIAYVTGRGVPQDNRQAAVWFEKASARGHKGAELQLRNLGASKGTNVFTSNVRQPARSELPDQKAAEAGDIDAQFRMGIAYVTGRGVPQDNRQAAVWFEKASARGHKGAELQLRNIRAGK